MEKLKEWLRDSRGYSIERYRLRSKFNLCDWFAYRLIGDSAKECETNGHKVQWAIYPFEFISGGCHRSLTVKIVGEVDGLWYTLECYSVPVKELKERLDHIEQSLLTAWNSLHT